MGVDTKNIAVRRKLNALIKTLPNTYWGNRYARLQEAKRLGITVISTEDNKG